MSEAGYIVLQVARQIGSGTGVANVANCLEIAFRDAGVPVRRLTAADLKLDLNVRSAGRLRRVVHLVEVICFSLVSPLAVRRYRTELKSRLVVISHNDCVLSDIYVNHGLHKALMRQRGILGVLRNPLHLFLLAREEVRHRLGMYRVVVCLSASEKQRLMQYYSVADDCIEVIPNGVDTVRFRAEPYLPIEGTKFRLLFVGHEFRRKRLDRVLDALALLDEDFVLEVVGGHESEIRRWIPEVEALGLEGRVEFRGVVADMAGVYQRAHCLVLPSNFEASPLVGLEAMACGLPCVMSSEAAVGGYLENGMNGFIADTGEAIASSIRRLRDTETYQQMRDNAVATARDHAWASIAERYRVVIDKLVGERLSS